MIGDYGAFVVGAVSGGAIVCLIGSYLLVHSANRRRKLMDDIAPPGWSDEAMRMYADNGAVATDGDNPWPHNKVCVRPGRCLIDHHPCNGFPRVQEMFGEDVEP